MSYWSNLQAASGARGPYYAYVIGFLIAAFLLLTYVPAAKRRLTTSLLLFLIGLGGLLLAAAVHTWGGWGADAPAKSAWYKWFRTSAWVLQGIATVNLISVFVFRFLLRSLRLEPPPILRDLILAAAYIVLAMGIFSQQVENLAGVVTASAIVSAVIGFSLQDTLGNIMAGMGLQMERSISVGDWIRIDNREGIVRETRWRQTSIETRDGDTILIPNAQIIKSAVTIVGRRVGEPQQHRKWVNFSIDYRYSPNEVIEAVNDALIEPLPHVVLDPPPYCVMIDLKDSTGGYGVCFWIDDPSYSDTTASAVRARIYAALKRSNIVLPTPAESDADARQRRQAEEMESRFQLLRKLNIFHPLTDDELHQLATRLRVAPFVKGEAITRQGASAHWLYILARGSAEVRLTSGGMVNQKVATLSPGDFFGEMGLLTGAPRSATVIAEVDCLCYRLDKDVFHEVMQRRPELAEGISHILARRRAELDAAKEDLDEADKRSRARSSEQDLLHRIRNFFFLGRT